MGANPKRSTGKSKRRWKRLQQQGAWIPYQAIEACQLNGDWDKDVMRMMARDRNHASDWRNDPALRFINIDLPDVANWMNEMVLHGVGAIKMTGSGPVYLTPKDLYVNRLPSSEV